MNDLRYPLVLSEVNRKLAKIPAARSVQTLLVIAAGFAAMMVAAQPVFHPAYAQGEDELCAAGGAVTEAVNNPGLVSDCETLLAARDALAGDVTLNWSETTPIGQWEGVTLGGSPSRVVWLSLHSRELTGMIPAGLGKLSKLQNLLLRDNELTGDIPKELGNLSRLSALGLNSNRLTGEVPAELGSLTNLIVLDLQQNQLTHSGHGSITYRLFAAAVASRMMH